MTGYDGDLLQRKYGIPVLLAIGFMCGCGGLQTGDGPGGTPYDMIGSEMGQTRSPGLGPGPTTVCSDNDECTVDWFDRATAECRNVSAAAGSWSSSLGALSIHYSALEMAGTGSNDGIDITQGGLFTGSTSCSVDHFSGSCSTSGDGRDVVFRMDVGVKANIKVVHTTTFTGTVYIRANDVGSDDLACAATGGTLTKKVAPGTYFLVVDGEGPEAYGEFSLDVTIEPDCSTCATDDPCFEAHCDLQEGCTFTPVSCDDGDICTVDRCASKEGCVHEPESCDDGDPCTDGTCSEGIGCVFTPSVCVSDNKCLTGTCDSLVGCIWSAVTCDDEDLCTDDSCIPSAGCVFAARTCEDGLVCTDDACDPKLGCLYPPTNCDDGDKCTQDSCDPASGCVYTARSCDDQDPCTQDSCEPANGCVYTSMVVNCQNENPCMVGTCDPTTGECMQKAIKCDDGDPCTTDSCDELVGCVAAPLGCDDSNLCTLDYCEKPVGCVHAPVSCDDGNACTLNACDPSAGCLKQQVRCDDNDGCTLDTCDSQSGCEFTAIPNDCGPRVCGSSPNGCWDCGVCDASHFCVEGACQGAPEGFVVVAPGHFLMGSPSDEVGRFMDESQHFVELSQSFLAKATEVTQKEWQDAMGNSPSFFDECGDTCPVDSVSWWDAVTFCNALSAKEGLESCYVLWGCAGIPGEAEYSCTGAYFKGLSCTGYRLPTEAEWEYLARAGEAATPVEDLVSSAWYYSNSQSMMHQTASLSPNSWGAFDMLGNVSEWCQDWYGDYPVSPVADPLGAQGGTYRVLRGGSCYEDAEDVRFANRAWTVPEGRYATLGFRIVRRTP